MDKLLRIIDSCIESIDSKAPDCQRVEGSVLCSDEWSLVAGSGVESGEVLVGIPELLRDKKEGIDDSLREVSLLTADLTDEGIDSGAPLEKLGTDDLETQKKPDS